jgi:hypothetical protein
VKTYTAHFYSGFSHASEKIEAVTPERALALARQMDENHEIGNFKGKPLVDHIEIRDENTTLQAQWRDEDLQLRRGAHEMLEALQEAECALREAAGRYESGNGRRSAMLDSGLAKVQSAIRGVTERGWLELGDEDAAKAVEPERRLPPDPEGMNDRRAEWAGAAVQDFRSRTGADFDDALSDLLCDLMHWSDRNGFDFDRQFVRVRTHCEAETSRASGVLVNALNTIAAGGGDPERMVQIAIAALEMAPVARAKLATDIELFGPDEPAREGSIYERYPGLTREGNEERDREAGRAFYDTVPSARASRRLTLAGNITTSK